MAGIRRVILNCLFFTIYADDPFFIAATDNASTVSMIAQKAFRS